MHNNASSMFAWNGLLVLLNKDAYCQCISLQGCH